MTTLAIHPGALGDLVLFARLLSHCPPPVTLVAPGETGALLAGLGIVHSAADFHSLPFHELFRGASDADGALARRLPRADRLISCFPAPDDSAACARLAALCAADSAAFLPVRPPDDFTSHLVDFWSDLLGISSPVSSSVSPFPTSSLSAYSLRGLRGLRGESLPSPPFLLIHPGAGSPAKCWPLERFLALARSAGPCVFVLGPVEQDRWAAADVDSIAREFPTLVSPPLPALAGLAALAAACLGNDSGFSHLAAAVGAPTVAIFGATNPVHFAPLGPRVRVLAADSLDTLMPARVLDELSAVARASRP